MGDCECGIVFKVSFAQSLLNLLLVFTAVVTCSTDGVHMHSRTLVVFKILKCTESR